MSEITQSEIREHRYLRELHDSHVEIERLQKALKRCADLIEDHYFEGDKEYQVVIIARAALNGGSDAP